MSVPDLSLQTTRKKSYWINSLIVVIIMFGFGHIPAPEPMTQLGMQVVGIFIGMVYGWLFCAQAWPSALGLFALGLTDYCTIQEAIQSGWGNNTIILVVFMMAVMGVLDHAGISEWLAYKLVSSKITKGRPWVLTGIIWAATIILSTTVSIIPLLVLMWGIIYSICEITGMEKGAKWPAIMCCATAYVGSCAFVIFPFKSLQAAVLGQYTELSGGEAIPFTPYFVWQMMVLIVSTIVFFVFVKFVMRPDVSKIANADFVMENKAKPLTKYQKFVLVYFVVVILFLILPGMLPKAWAITGFMNNLGVTGTGIMALALITFCGFKEGPSLKELMGRSVSWDLIFLLMGALAIAAAMQAEETGINAWIVATMVPLLSGKSGILVMALILLLAGLTTQVCNNLATAVMFTPIAYNIAIASGNINMPALMLCLIGVCNVALLLPSGSAPAAMLWGNKEWCDSKTIIVTGLTEAIINLVVCIGLGVPLATLML